MEEVVFAATVEGLNVVTDAKVPGRDSEVIFKEVGADVKIGCDDVFNEGVDSVGPIVRDALAIEVVVEAVARASVTAVAGKIPSAAVSLVEPVYRPQASDAAE